MQTFGDKPTVRPFIKWVGGKRRILNKLLPFVPKNIETYVEPFVGSGAMYFNLTFKKAIINDLNYELICAYKQIRDDVESLQHLLNTFSYDKEEFYKVRAWDREPNFKDRPQIEHAARIIFLLKTCYNGLYRVNSKNYFNTPFGSFKNPKICDEKNLLACSQYINQHPTKIYNLNYHELIKLIPKNSFVYLDPPYHPVNETSYFTSYQPGVWTHKEQIELFEFCKKLDKRGIKFMQSNSSADFILDLYKDFNIHFIEAPRSINSVATERGVVKESVIVNY